MMEGALELIHQETLPSSPFLLRQTFVSEKFIVSLFGRQLKDSLDDDDEMMAEIIIELRSSADFTIIRIFEKEIISMGSSYLGFYNDILAIFLSQPLQPQEFDNQILYIIFLGILVFFYCFDI